MESKRTGAKLGGLRARKLVGWLVGATLAACGASSRGEAEFEPEGDAGASDAARAPSREAGSFGPLDGASAGDSGRCAVNLTGIVRDFSDKDPHKHPDFETFVGDGETGIVKPLLGADHKPVYASASNTRYTTGKAAFDQWFRNVPGVNVPIEYKLVPTANAGVLVFDSQAFFPIDNQGFGNEGRAHNYSFTLEFHTQFVYKGGEVFSFTGDDDLWVFVNDHLAIDLGGVHEPKAGRVDFDARAAELGITKGGTYELSVFQAERHTPGSNFRIETSVEFTNCNPIIR